MKITLYLFLVISPLFAKAQTPSGQCSGYLIDSIATKPIPFATVALQRPDGQFYTGMNTNKEGLFQFDNVAIGAYRLSISSVGYQTRILPVLLTPEKPTIMLGAIYLLTEEKNLREVQVVGRKAIVEHKGDRLVYNAERDLSNAGGMAVDIMRKVPTLTVDPSGNLQMRGSGNIRVLVNGKPSSAMTNNLSNALKQMPASIIKAVEVITSPGAKYDAEGSAGIVNIVTKKAALGFHGTVNAKAGNVNNTLGGNVAIRGKKAGISLSTSGYSNRNHYGNQSVRTALTGQNGSQLPTGVLYQTSNQDNTSLGSYSEMNVDYDPDSTNHLNLSGSFWNSRVPNNSILTTRLTNASDTVLEAFRRAIESRTITGNIELNLGWTKVFRKSGRSVASQDEPDRELSILSQYSRMPDNNQYHLTQTNLLSDIPTYLERSTNLSHNNEYTLQTDYIHPFQYRTRRDTLTCKVEIGAKTIHRDLSSTYKIDASTTGLVADYMPDFNQSDEFGYTQRVTSGYASLQAESKRHWNFIMGLRLEHTGIQGNFMTTQTTFRNRYSNLTPNVTLSKTINDQHTLKISYTQRLSRPLIYYLNPYRNFTDSKNVRAGNPYLDPERTHSSELEYSTFSESGFSLTTALFWRHTNNDIQILTVVDRQGVGVSTPQNIGRNAAYGLNVSTSLEPLKNLSLYANTTVILADLTNAATRQRTKGWIFNSSLSTTYKFPKSVSVQVDGYYTSGQILLQNRIGGWYFYGLAIRKEFMADKKASLALNLNNPFTPSLVIQNNDIAPGYISASTSSLLVNRSFSLTFIYRFGKENDEPDRKKISNDDGKIGKPN